MSQSFLTYEQLIDKLENEKNLVISNRQSAISVLKKIGYFALIGGYKELFKNPTTKKYNDGTRFEDIVALYKFDENLRELFLKYILKIERHLRSTISYYFCEKYGENQSFYLDANNFSIYPKFQADVQRLIGELNNLANKNNDYAYINYHRKIYNNVPLWVLFNGVSFGVLSKFYILMTQDLQFKVSREFKQLSEKQLGQLLSVVTKFRNVCAHNERLFSYKTKNTIPNLPVHKMLNINKKGNTYSKGLRDLFAIVVAFKYLLSEEEFDKFKDSLSNTIEHFSETAKTPNKQEVLKAMGFPKNWYDI